MTVSPPQTPLEDIANTFRRAGAITDEQYDRICAMRQELTEESWARSFAGRAAERERKAAVPWWKPWGRLSA